MLWIYLLTLQILFFVGLLYFFLYVSKRNVVKATSRLHELSKEYTSKEEEASRLLQDAQKESKGIVARETQAAREIKEQLIKEAKEQKEEMIREANQKGDDITKKAQKNAEFIRKELEQRIDNRAKEKVYELMQQAIPKDFLQNVHQQWADESEKGTFEFKHLKLPEKVKDAKVVSAFPLTDQQQKSIEKNLKKKIGADVVLKVEVDPSLMAGFVITIGSVVVDASLKYKIQSAMKE